MNFNADKQLTKLERLTESWINQLELIVTEYGLRLFFSLLIVCLGIWLAGKVSQLAYRAMKARGVDATIRRFVDKVIYVFIVVITLITALSQIGIQTTTIIAALGAVGLAIALALQASLSNFAAGLLLVMFRPCKVGDYVETLSVGGTVRAINLLYTSLLTDDHKVVTIPNSQLLNSPLTNFSAMPKRRVDLTLNLHIDADIEKAKTAILHALSQDTRVLNQPPPFIAPQALNEFSINIAVRCWVNTHDYWPVTYALNESIKYAFDEADIKMASKK